MVEPTLNAHARAAAQGIRGARYFFAALIYFELEENCGAVFASAPTSTSFADAGW